MSDQDRDPEREAGYLGQAHHTSVYIRAEHETLYKVVADLCEKFGPDVIAFIVAEEQRRKVRQ